MAWVRDQVGRGSGLASATTGEKLSWWDGRQQSIVAMQKSYDEIGKENDRQKAVREAERMTPRHVNGFHRVSSEPFTWAPMVDLTKSRQHLRNQVQQLMNEEED
jgi:hypothetical protein